MTQPETNAQVRDRLAEKYAKEIRNDAVIGPLPLEKIMAVKFGWNERDKLAQQEVDDARKDGILDCIKSLRDLQKEYRHERKWNHCAKTEFAPVELSDYLLTNLIHKKENTAKHKKEGEV